MSTEAPRLRYRLPRAGRLQGAREFLRTKELGSRRVCGCLILNWLPLSAGAGTRVGIVTSRRLGGAVVRNRARRLIREAFRLHQHSLKAPIQLVLVARSSVVGRPLGGVVRDLRRGLTEAGLWSEPGKGSSSVSRPGSGPILPAGPSTASTEPSPPSATSATPPCAPSS